MPNKTGRIFSFFSVFSALVAVLLVSSAVLSVFLTGVPYIFQSLNSNEFRFSVRLSLTTSVISTLLCLLLSVPASYAFARERFPLKHFFEIILELTACLPYIVTGFCLLIMFSSPFGLWLKSIGIRIVFDRKGIVVAQMFVNLPFMVRLVRTAFMQVDTRLEKTAGVLGASRFRQFLTITLPLSRLPIMSAAVLTWARAMGEFGATLMLVGVTRLKTETLPGNIYLNISTGDTGLAMASAMVMIIISLLVTCFTDLLNRKPKYFRFEQEQGL